MNQLKLKDKVLAVIGSCETVGQLENAMAYANLAMQLTPSSLRLKHAIAYERAHALVSYIIRTRGPRA